MPGLNLAQLRRHAVARSLPKPTTLGRAIERLGFVQADPIRAPARAQDLILRQRVAGYRAGDLDRRYARLPIEEDGLVNYGFLPREHLALMHPREPRRPWDAATAAGAADLLAFVRERGCCHPREVQAAFAEGRDGGPAPGRSRAARPPPREVAHGTPRAGGSLQGRVRNAWGGQSNAVTHLLDAMHYRGMLRVARREAGVRVYAAAAHAGDDRSPDDKAEALLDLVLNCYAPLPSASLGQLASMLAWGAPQARDALARRLSAMRRETPQARVDGVTWFWPAGEDPRARRWRVDDRVRLLAPFDPVVWDRRRFELFWGWAYRFEAYLPAARRRLGYYALPLLWRGEAIGWANAVVRDGVLDVRPGFVAGSSPRDAAFANAFDAEVQRLRECLGHDGG